MDKKEFIFPGVILGLVLIIAVGLLLTQGRQTTPPFQPVSVATTTASSTISVTPGKTGTSPSAPANYYPYGTVVLSINQAAGFKSGLSIRPTAVTEDSRCPSNVVCIQAGTVKISLKATVSGKSSTHSLALGSSVTINGDKITLKSVTPARTTEATPAASAYRFTFVVEQGGVVAGPCYVGGCSSELCTETKGQVSACLYSESYACYRTATCERQPSGSCGWTPTTELNKCLASKSGTS